VCMCIFCIYGILGIDTDVPWQGKRRKETKLHFCSGHI
jgi:hypothetical protein